MEREEGKESERGLERGKVGREVAEGGKKLKRRGRRLGKGKGVGERGEEGGRRWRGRKGMEREEGRERGCRGRKEVEEERKVRERGRGLERGVKREEGGGEIK